MNPPGTPSLRTETARARGAGALDARILSALRGAGRRGIARADLAHKVGLTPRTLSRHLETLAGLGYQIELEPHIGYRLLRTPDALHADDLHSRLGKTRVIGRDIQVFQETTSTNDVVDKLARDQVKEGAVVFAETQTRGRGRLGRRWISPPGKGLWFSVLLRPNLPPESATQLTIAAATALARAIRSQTELRPEIKWPNDILIRGRKVAGVLTELSAELDRIRYVILGIGVDVNQGADEFPTELRSIATSLRIERGQALDRPALAAAVLHDLDHDYHRVLRGEFEAVASEWEDHCTTLGQDVCIQVGHRQLRGRAESLDGTGALLLRTHHGHLERVTGGDVTLKPKNDPAF